MGKQRDGKWVYMILSLLIAMVLWVYVGKEADPVKNQFFNNIPVTLTGVDRLEEQGLILSNGADQKVSLRLEARNSILKELAEDGRIEVSANVSAITQPGEYTLEYTYNFRTSTLVGGTSSVTVQEKRPAALTITVSRRSEPSVEVRGSFTGSVADGFQIGTFSIAPSTIQLSGTEEAVSRVSYAQVTLNEENLSETFSGEMPFTLYDFEGNPIEQTTGITTDVSTVSVTLPVVKLKEVPLQVDINPGGGATEQNAKVTIEPKSITVSGSQKDLDALKEIRLLGSVDLSKVYTSEDYVFEIPLAQELTNESGITSAAVHVEIQGLTTRTVEVDNIEFIHVPDEYRATSITQSRQIQIRGPQAEVEAILPSQLRMVVDWDDLSSHALGNQTAPVKVYLDGSSTVGVVGSDYNISILISQ
ncbi:MAG: hypothetical protein HFE97_12810 [Oscillospiraceae bacterium]|nr:hypothetical protein [Oscillospiraceae bacterium]